MELAEIIQELTSSGLLVLFGWLAIKFLVRSLEKKDNHIAGITAEYKASVETIADRTNQAMDRNTDAMNRNTEATNQNRQAIRDLQQEIRNGHT